MSMDIPSPVTRWPGTISLPAYLNFIQYRAWKSAVLAAHAVLSANRPADAGPESTWAYDEEEYRHQILAGICGVVETWNLQALPARPTPDTLPFAPATDALALFNWLFESVNNVARGVDGDDPKLQAPSSAG